MYVFRKSWLSLLMILVLASSASVAWAEKKTTFFHLDAAGSPVAATDEAGNLKWREELLPYGERLQNEPAATDNTRWFTGHPHDEDTGLTYAGARHYDPVVGRFMGVDPQDFSEDNPQSFNRFAYANNNPYAYVDPDGKDALATSDSGLAENRQPSLGAGGVSGILTFNFAWGPFAAQFGATTNAGLYGELTVATATGAFSYDVVNQQFSKIFIGLSWHAAGEWGGGVYLDDIRQEIGVYGRAGYQLEFADRGRPGTGPRGRRGGYQPPTNLGGKFSRPLITFERDNSNTEFSEIFMP